MIRPSSFLIVRTAVSLPEPVGGPKTLPRPATAITPVLGKMDYVRLSAVRAVYAQTYSADLRDDLKRKRYTSTRYAKLVRHYTLTRAALSRT